MKDTLIEVDYEYVRCVREAFCDSRGGTSGLSILSVTDIFILPSKSSNKTFVFWRIFR